MEAVLKKIAQKEIQANPIAVISDKADAFALEIGKKFGLKPIVIPFKDYKNNRAEFDKKLKAALTELSPDLIVAAGYMKIIDTETIRHFRYKIINIHPSLLPAFPGTGSQKQAFDYGVKITGCTTHFVDEGMDSGPIILQSAIKVRDGITERDLNLMILREEHKILPLTVKYFCENKININNRKVTII